MYFNASCSCNSAIIEDVNRDDTLDTLLVGNLLDVKVETDRHDASNWLLLPGDTGCIYPLKVMEIRFYELFNAESMLNIKLNASLNVSLVTSNDNKVTAFS
jgi:hypothetical protein